MVSLTSRFTIPNDTPYFTAIMISKQNALNFFLSIAAILCIHLSGMSVFLFWTGTMLVVPAVSVLYQIKYAQGKPLCKLVVALLPWILLCSIGLLHAAQTSLEEQKAINMFFFEMPLYSALGGGFAFLMVGFVKKVRATSK